MNLGRPDRSRRLDALAAEYALGTMPARARRRMAHALRADPVVAQAVGTWELRIATLATAIPGVTPPPRVWEGIRARLGLDPAPRATTGRGAASASWWASLGLWRGLAAAGLAAALVLGIALFGQRAEQPVGSFMVVLAGSDAKPIFVASASRNGRFLTVKSLAPVALAADRALELWGLPTGGSPRSLGLIPASGIAQVALPAAADIALQNFPMLAVSLEPAGGSPTGAPTGPVLYTGGVQKMD